MEVAPAPPATLQQPGGCWTAPAAILGIASICTALILKSKHIKATTREEAPAQPTTPSSDDERQYQRALARTRQATHISKSLGLLKMGDVSKAYMELQLALAENQICRSACLVGNHSKDEFLDLYRLHIKSQSEVPPQFSTLLQLKEMLGISGDEAERVEAEVMQTPGAFCI